MANHPIPFVSPIQIAQMSIAQNRERFSPSTSDLLSTGAASSEASISTVGNIAATDVNVMQANDATAFVYGSRPSDQSTASNNYTTVDDAAKLAIRVAADNDVIDAIKRENQKKKKQTKPNNRDAHHGQIDETNVLEPYDDTHYRLKNTMMLASHGLV